MTEQPLPPPGIGKILFAILLFGAMYLAFSVFLGLAIRLATPDLSMAMFQWLALLAVAAATIAVLALHERRILSLGIVMPPARAGRDLVAGLAWALVFAIAVDAVILLFGNLQHNYSGSLRASEVFGLLIPAALHEELLFRGYPFQKLLQWNRWIAVFLGAFIFTAIHFGNQSISGLGLLNIFVAGVLLSLAYIARTSLWFPIGLHYGWNAVTGPLLGHEVSGFRMSGTLFGTVDRGPAIVTGGDFGVEGSVCSTVLAIAVAVLLWRRIEQNRTKLPAVAQAGAEPAQTSEVEST